ncbi:uncharacterized protein LOC143837442 [Paroedura picta]|uniref:uncharacterized protein LOC143837442 n=1 Tax=Paroedura picta TaxID=143630 RepID=UPI0040579E16
MGLRVGGASRDTASRLRRCCEFRSDPKRCSEPLEMTLPSLAFYARMAFRLLSSQAPCERDRAPPGLRTSFVWLESASSLALPRPPSSRQDNQHQHQQAGKREQMGGIRSQSPSPAGIGASASNLHDDLLQMNVVN